MSTDTLTDRILLPLDGSWVAMTAIPWLRALATADTHLVLLRASSITLPIVEIGQLPMESFDRMQRDELSSAHAYVEAVANELADVTTDVTTLARLGAPADEILAVAEAHDVHLIVMATEGRGAAGRLFVGSVGDRVARAATVPVMLVPARAEPAPFIEDPAPIGRLVVPFDGSDLARSALPVATALARRLDAPVRVVRVLPTVDDAFRQRDALNTGSLFQRLVETIPTIPQRHVDTEWYEGYVASVRAALDAEAAKLAATGIPADAELRIGETVPSLLDALAPEDLVVMTSHGQGGVRRWLMGSVAEQLIHQAVAPVVLVPAPGRDRIAP